MLLSGFLFLLFRLRAGTVLNPAAIYCAGWFFQFLLLALPIFNFLETPDFMSFIFLILIVIAVPLGVYIADITKIRKKNITNSVNLPIARREWLLYKWCALLGILGQVAIIVDIQVTSTMSLSERFLNVTIADVRGENFERLNDSVAGPLAQLESVLSPLSWLTLILAIYFYIREKQYFEDAKLNITNKIARRIKITIFLAFVNFFLIVINSVFIFGGRINIIFAILMAIFSYAIIKLNRNYQPKKISLKFKKYLIIFLITIGIIAGALSMGSARQQSENVEYLLYAGHRATFAPEIRNTVIGNQGLGYFLLALSYFTVPVPTLLIYLKLPEHPGPYFGQYSFPLIARLVYRITGDNDSQAWIKIRREIFSPLESRGYFGNVWPTIARDLIADFTHFGAIIFLVLLGFFSQLVWRSAKLGKSSSSVSLYALLILILAFSPFVNIIYISIIHVLLFQILAIKIFLRL